MIKLTAFLIFAFSGFYVFKTINDTSIQENSLFEKEVILEDGEVFELDTDDLYTSREFGNIIQSIFGITRSELPETPVVLRSFEKNEYDFEIFKAYTFAHLEPHVVKTKHFTFWGPIHFYFYNKNEIIQTVNPAPFTEENFATFYQKLFDEQQLTFFHSMLQSKIGRTALFTYGIQALEITIDRIPQSLKVDMIQQIKKLKSFITSFEKYRITYQKFEKDNTILDKLASWEAFAYRRIIHDKIPAAELLEFLNNLNTVILNSTATYGKLYKVSINAGELIISDTTNNDIVLSSSYSNRRIVFQGDRDFFVRMFNENGKHFYKLERKIGYNEYKFLGLFSSKLETIRSAED
jgi:hypothetical protein